MFKYTNHWFSLVVVIVVFGATGCQTASNMIAGLRGKRPAVASVAGTPAPTSTAMAQPLPVSPYPQTSSGTTSYAAAVNPSAPSKRDPLYGFYPEDVDEESYDANEGSGGSSECSSGSCSSSSISSRSSGACSSGCCSR